MAEMQGAFVQEDPNAPNPQGIQLPQIDLPPEDTSLHITVRPSDAQMQKQRDARQMKTKLDQEVEARNTQLNTPRPDVWPQVGKAILEGATRDDARDYLTSSGLSQSDADAHLVESLQSRITQGMKAGYSEQEMQDFLSKKGVDSTLVQDAFKTLKVNKDWQKYDFNPNVRVEAAENMADLYKNIHTKYSTLGKLALSPISDDMRDGAAADIHKLNVTIADKMTKQGFKVYVDQNTGELMFDNEAGGQPVPLDSSFLRGVFNSKYENIGAVTGGVAGFVRGGQIGAEVGSMVQPGSGTIIGGTVGAVGGSVLGAGLGGAAGRGLDVIQNSLTLKEDLESRLILSQMVDAGVGNAAMDIVGQALIKVGVSGFRGIKRAYRYVTAGNSKGAYNALKENLPITDEQAEEIVKEFTRINGKAPPGKDFAQQAIAAVSATQQGGELAIAKAASVDPKLYSSVLADLNARAKGLTSSVRALTDENVGAIVRQDLNAYQSDVKQFYEMVKQDGIGSIQGTDFRFDLEKLAIKPVLADIEKSLGNPIMRERYLSYAMRIENASKDRTFSGLVELREAINEFKYSKSLGHDDLKAINGVINRIDSQIGSAAADYMGKAEAKRWLGNFNMAKAEYAKMKQLEENVLFHAVTKEGTTEKGIQAVLSKFANNKDVDAETFNAVINRVSGATRTKVEGAAIKNLVDKAKVQLGEDTASQAINFPLLADQLKHLNITTPQAKALVDAINEFAKVFKNDQMLYQITAGTPNSKIQSSLSSNLLGKAKMTLIGALWHSGIKFIPGKTTNNLALIHQVSKLFENPLHQNTVETLMKQVPQTAQPEMRSLVKNLQIETAKANAAKAAAKPSDWLNMYKQSSSGKMTVSEGALGKGIYLFDKIANPSSDMRVIKHEVNLSRMASLKDLDATVDGTGNLTLEAFAKLPKSVKADITKKLQDKGFLGIRVDGKAMLFPEDTIVKQAKPKKGKY